MTTPNNGVGPAEPDEPRTPEPDASPPPEGTDPTAPPTEQRFDPYRFGAPEHPVPPEYAPPGYVPPAASNPAAQPPQVAPPTPGQSGWGQSGYGQSGYGQSGWGGHAGYPPPGQSPYPPPGQPPYPPPGQPPYPPPYSAYLPPGQSPYPQAYPGYPPPRPGHGKAITALVLGICSILFFWTTFFDVLLIIPALVFGFMALSEARRAGGGSRGMARAGLICTAVGTVLALAFTIFALHRVNHCTDLYGSSGPAYDHCVRQL
jgi:hypothetical protein